MHSFLNTTRSIEQIIIFSLMQTMRHNKGNSVNFTTPLRKNTSNNLHVISWLYNPDLSKVHLKLPLTPLPKTHYQMCL